MSSTFVGEDGRVYRLISCTIRNTGTGWAALDEAGHEPTGITGVITNSDHVRIDHAVGAVKVSSFQVTPDETLAAMGVRVGISAGLDYSRIQLYTAPGTLASPASPVNPATVVAAGGNIWITGWLVTAP
jgi:hypothetical protein